jgi:hypothetical protein
MLHRIFVTSYCDIWHIHICTKGGQLNAVFATEREDDRVTFGREAVRMAEGILFDLPLTIDRAKSRIESAGLDGRIKLVGSDFPPVPACGRCSVF